MSFVGQISSSDAMVRHMGRCRRGSSASETENSDEEEMYEYDEDHHNGQTNEQNGLLRRRRPPTIIEESPTKREPRFPPPAPRRGQRLSVSSVASLTSPSPILPAHPPSPPMMVDLPLNNNVVPLEIDVPFAQKLRTFRVRFLWTVILILSFFLILAAGHFYAGALVLALTMLIYREVIALKRNAQKDERLPLFFFLRWYWFFLTIYATGYESVGSLAEAMGLRIPRSVVVGLIDYHMLISYTGAFMGFMIFIFSLRKFSLRYQFSQFAIMIMCCLLVVGQTVFQIANIYNGLIWFIISSSSVIVNDCFAYLCGVLWGRTRLIRLSPKKTVEGFLGASVVTLIWSVAISDLLSRFQVAICPQPIISFRPFSVWKQLHCDPHPVFIPHIEYSTFWGIITIKPIIIHGLVLGAFAAFFAPFGGFFASALKRALRVKDFAETIPGHGGITDRFDCQIVMGTFTYLYVRTFVFKQTPSLAGVLKTIERLPLEEKKMLYEILTQHLAQ